MVQVKVVFSALAVETISLVQVHAAQFERLQLLDVRMAQNALLSVGILRFRHYFQRNSCCDTNPFVKQNVSPLELSINYLHLQRSTGCVTNMHYLHLPDISPSQLEMLSMGHSHINTAAVLM